MVLSYNLAWMPKCTKNTNRKIVWGLGGQLLYIVDLYSLDNVMYSKMPTEKIFWGLGRLCHNRDGQDGQIRNEIYIYTKCSQLI